MILKSSLSYIKLLTLIFRNKLNEIDLDPNKVYAFNPTKNWDFIPNFTLGNTEIETLEEMKMLGLIAIDLSWKSKTETMTQKAYSRLWILREKRGTSLEFWTQTRSVNIKRGQKSFFFIELGSN